MRAHLWLGMIALPLIWFHAGFAHGGVLTSVLMWLLYITVVSGLIGAVLQHTLPGYLTDTVEHEVTYQQIGVVLRHIASEADHLVSCYCGPVNGEDRESWRASELEWIRWSHDHYMINDERRAELEAAVANVATAAAATAPGTDVLKSFYLNDVRPVLRGRRSSPLLKSGRAEVRFRDQQVQLPQLHAPIEQLRRLWDRRRTLLTQRRVQRWMYAWMFVHVPVSYALLVLSVFHSLTALRYTL